MVDSDRRPSAQEIEELIDLVRRDPASPAFIDLAEAYLNLGRPKDAISVGKVGLDAAPDSLEGRVVLARAYAAMHQWKEAQGELLRVVKVDRSNRLGFALLGEVLLRRNDYERAVPVLQHAQNLDPTSPQILSMLKRARMNQPLDAPTPVPQPVPPRGETNYGLSLDESARQPVPPPAPARVPAAGPAMPTMAISPASDMRGDATEHNPNPHGGWAEPPRAAKKSLTAPPPMSVEGVRPRVVSAARPANAAAASLRQSAAVGENYLNDLLTGGLLDVAGVRVPDADFDLRPDRRWGRSTRRAFIFLFVVLVVAIGGGGTYYWWTAGQRNEAVRRLHKEAKDSIKGASFDDLEGCLKNLGEALEKDKSNILTFTYIAECGGLESLLYGTDDNRVTQAIKAVQKDVKATDPGARELVIGKAAVTLATLAKGDAPASALADVRKMLDDYLAKHDGDKWARWLKARAMLAGGERKEAIAVLKVAADGDDAVVPAIIDLADLLVDDGKLDEALATYKRALEKSKDHPLAILGRAMALAESTVDSNAAIDDLSVKLDKNIGPRVASYRNLAFALANENIEDFIKSGEMLKASTDKSTPPAEPRFWARVAWARYMRGDYKGAAEARGRIAWFGKNNAEDDPEVMLVDAALTLASGLPDKTLAIASKIEGVRSRLLRAQAQLDLKNAKGAMEDLTWILEKAADNLQAQMLQEEAKMMIGSEKERAVSAEALEKLARKTKSKIGRHALGMGYYLAGNLKDAQTQLQQAVTGVTEDEPNPLSYRTRTTLADILLTNGEIKAAGDELDKALATNSGYLPTRIMQARVVLRNNDPDRALNLLTAVLKETTTPDASLLQVEAICASKQTTAKNKEQAKEVVSELVKKNDQFHLAPEELSRVAAVCDPNLPEELGLPAPGAAPSVAPAPAKPAKPTKPAKKRRGR